MMTRRSSAWFLLAGALAAAAWFGTVRAGARGESVDVLVAARDLAVGSAPDSPGNAAWVAVPASGVLPGMVSDPGAVGARRLAVPLGAGEPITDASLGGAIGRMPAPLQLGERAISVPAPAAGAALPVLVPGVRVDIVASLGDRGAAVIVVRGAEVIGVQTPGDEFGSGEGSVLMRVRAADALRLSAAIDRAVGVRILPRPSAEEISP
jgi:Flp pilus assembly protein CpaB